MSKVAINIEGFTKFKDIVCTPSSINHLPELWYQMNTALNLTDWNDGHTPAMIVGGPQDLVHSEVRYWIAKLGKPFNIGQRLRE